MNNASISVTIPVKNGDIETAYLRATWIKQELESFFKRLETLVYYHELMPTNLCVARRLESKDDIALVVEAVWVSDQSWITVAAQEYIDAYICHHKIGE
jgi:hypothetical protein